MDQEQLTTHLKSIRRSTFAINRSLRALEAFEIWLVETSDRTIDDEIRLEDLQTFIQTDKKGQKILLLGLADVFAFQGREELKNEAMQMRRAILNKHIKPMRLKDFIGVDQALISSLAEEGLRNAHQLLKACRTPQDRQKLAAEHNIPFKDLLDLVKMADLWRIRGVKAVRTRLYLDSGFDTLDKLAAQDPMALRRALVAFVDESGFDGIASLPKECEFTIKKAREMDRWVTFEEDE